MIKKHSVVITNPTNAIRYCGSLRLGGYRAVNRILTDTEIQKLKAAGFVVNFKENKEEKVSKACYGCYNAFNDCNECWDKENCQLSSINEENFPYCYGINYGENVWCATRCNYKDKCKAILEPVEGDFEVVEAKESPECFGIEYDDYEDCDDCEYGETCKNSMVELELTDEDLDEESGVEIVLIKTDPDKDTGIKVNLVTNDPDADPTDDEPNWTDENLENPNDD